MSDLKDDLKAIEPAEFPLYMLAEYGEDELIVQAAKVAHVAVCTVTAHIRSELYKKAAAKEPTP